MTRRKKRIYLTIIALSAVGWVVDRLTMPAPVAAVLAVSTPGSRPPRKSTPASASGSSATGAEKPALLAATRFPQKLRRTDPPSRDLFGPTETARTRLIGQGGVSGEIGGVAPDDVRLLADRFTEAHVLSAVINDGAFSVAVVDGSWVRVGEEIDGCRLESIDGQRVVFDCAGTAVELSVGHEESAE